LIFHFYAAGSVWNQALPNCDYPYNVPECQATSDKVRNKFFFLNFHGIMKLANSGKVRKND
jgi:hypothetical protein